MDSIIVIDDIVDVEIQNQIEQALLGADTKWTFNRYTAYKKERFPQVSNEQRMAITSFTHLALDGVRPNPYYNLYMQVIEQAASRLNFEITQVIGMRANLQVPVYQKFTNGIPHVDLSIVAPYKIGLYYVNDSDGDTELYDQTSDNTTIDEIKKREETLRQAVSPKKGRFVLFDGNIYHRAGLPTKEIRCVLNYNFFIKELA